MSGLNFLEVLDRFTGVASSLKEKASHSSQAKTRYTEAVLSPNFYAVRDADPVEAALFTVVPPVQGEGYSVVDVKRKELVSATPLRKTREKPLALLDPEEYVGSVLRLGEQYQVMPRAQAHAKELLHQSYALKRRIPELERSLKDLQSAGTSAIPRPDFHAIHKSVKVEEKLTREMEARVAAAREHRDRLRKLLDSRDAGDSSAVDESDVSTFTSPSAMRGLDMGGLLHPTPMTQPTPKPMKPLTTAQAIAQRRAARQAARGAKHLEKQAPTVSQPPSDEEAAFWNAPSSSQVSKRPAKQLSPDVTEDSTTSTSQADSPAFPTLSGRPSTLQSLKWSLGGSTDTDAETDVQTETTTEAEAEAEADPQPPSREIATAAEDDDDGNSTVILPTALPARQTFSLLRNSIARSTETGLRPARQKLQVEASVRSPSPEIVVPPTLTSTSPSATPKPLKTKVASPDHASLQLESTEPPEAVEVSPSEPSYSFMITTTTERQIAQTWKSVGDVLVPNHTYDVGLGKGSVPPPPARETLRLLSVIANVPTPSTDQAAYAQALATVSQYASTPNTSVPSISTLQVLTALLVFSLLAASDSTLPMSSLKETLKGNPWAIEAAPETDFGTKAIYHCVGKKLIAIDRKEGVVRFAKF